jgi:hypothetical protein
LPKNSARAALNTPVPFLMNQTLALVFAMLVLSPLVVWGQEEMTPARFRKIASVPGDHIPLNPKLAATGPWWANVVVSVALEYEDGKTFKEEIAGTSKTVGGKYIVNTVLSKFYKQPMDSILTYDEKTSNYKVFAIYGETITEGRIVYDFSKKIYATSSAYGDGFTEQGVGSYTDAGSSDRTLIFKNGVLFCTRETKTTPANESK